MSWSADGHLPVQCALTHIKILLAQEWVLIREGWSPLDIQTRRVVAEEDGGSNPQTLSSRWSHLCFELEIESNHVYNWLFFLPLFQVHQHGLKAHCFTFRNEWTKLYWENGQVTGFKISSKLEWPGSLFRAGGAPVPGGGRVLHRLPSHSQKVPQLQRNSLWRTFQFLSTSYIDINNIVQLWFIFGKPDLQFDINILVCYCWGSLRVSIYSAINGMILQYGGFCDWPREQTWTQA